MHKNMKRLLIKAISIFVALVYYFGFIMLYAIAIYMIFGNSIAGREAVFQIASGILGVASGTALVVYLLRN